jgi:hypothetical protein
MQKDRADAYLMIPGTTSSAASLVAPATASAKNSRNPPRCLREARIKRSIAIHDDMGNRGNERSNARTSRR